METNILDVNFETIFWNIINDILAVFALMFGDIHETQVFWPASYSSQERRGSPGFLSNRGLASRSRLGAFSDRPLDLEFPQSTRPSYFGESFLNL